MAAMRTSFTALAALLLWRLPAPAQEKAALPAPDLADVAYGPHQRNVLDLWKAKSRGLKDPDRLLGGRGMIHLLETRLWPPREQRFRRFWSW